MPDTCGYTTRYTVLLLYNKEGIFTHYTHYNWTTIDTNWLVICGKFRRDCNSSKKNTHGFK